MSAPVQIAWVSGASGFWGRKIILALLRRGWQVIALSRTEPLALMQWAEAQGHSLRWQPFDLARPDWQALEALPTPGAAFHCAACLDESDFAGMVTVNVIHGIQLLETIITRMRVEGRGRLGVLLGQNGRLGLPGLAPFSATQGALWTWAEGTQRELKGCQIAISLVFPPRAPSALQQQLARHLNHPPRPKVPKTADPLVAGVLAGKRRVGRKPWLAALAMLAG